MSDNKAIRLLERRKQLGFTQEALETLSGVSQAQISRYERGDSDLTTVALVAVARALHVSADWLLGLTDDPTPGGLHEDGLTETERAVFAAWRRGDRAEAAKIILNG